MEEYVVLETIDLSKTSFSIKDTKKGCCLIDGT